MIPPLDFPYFPLSHAQPRAHSIYNIIPSFQICFQASLITISDQPASRHCRAQFTCSLNASSDRDWRVPRALISSRSSTSFPSRSSLICWTCSRSYHQRMTSSQSPLQRRHRNTATRPPTSSRSSHPSRTRLMSSTTLHPARAASSLSTRRTAEPDPDPPARSAGRAILLGEGDARFDLERGRGRGPELGVRLSDMAESDVEAWMNGSRRQLSQHTDPRNKMLGARKGVYTQSV